MSSDQLQSIAPHCYAMAEPQMPTSKGWTTVTAITGVGTFIPLRVASKPAELLVLMDRNENGGSEYVTFPNLLSSGVAGPIGQRHRGTVNCLFADFHVENVPYSKLTDMNKSPGTGLPSTWFQLN